MDTTRHEGRARRFTRPVWMLVALASLVLLVTILVIFGEDTEPAELRGGGHESALAAPEPEGTAATRRARADAAPDAQEPAADRTTTQQKTGKRAARVSGVVVSPSGARIQSSRVVLMLVGGSHPEDRTYTDERGVFSFETTNWPRGAATLTALSEGFQSTTTALVVHPGMERQDIELRLHPGLDLEGQVLLRGRPCSAKIELDLAPGDWGLAPRNVVDGNPLCLHEGEVERKKIEAMTDAEGRFRFEGLRAATYRLQLEPWVRDVVFVPPRILFEITLPEEPMVVKLEHVRQLIRLVDRKGEPVRGAITLRHRATGAKASPDVWLNHGTSELEAAVLPEEDYEVQAAAQGYLPVQLSFTASKLEKPEPIVVRFQAIPERRMRLVLHGSHQRGVTQVGLDVLRRLEGSGPDPTQNDAFKTINFGCFLGDVPGQADHFLSPPFQYPAGVYQVRLHVEESELDDPVPITTKLEVPAEGEVRLELDYREPGSLRLVSAAARGAAPWGHWELSHADGTILEDRCFDLEEARESPESVLIGPLEAGTYSLRLDIEGRASEVHEVQIVGGETCRFAVSGTAAPKPDDMDTWRMQKTIASMIRRQQSR